VTPFFWVGDTAWSAPAVEIDAQLHPGTFTQQWSQYLATRTPDGSGTGNYHFTAILVSPADNFAKHNDPDVFFAQPAPCTVPASQVGSYPNDCSIPKPAYWNAFDSIVSRATNQDLLLVIGGLIHPFDTSPYPKYPSLNNVTHFSRYLAARMAGFAVMFSPGFDMPLSTTAVDGNTLNTVMDASGSAVQAASPNVLITNHLNGQATCTDYESFAGEGPWPKPWMRSYLFQSGHAISPNGTAGTLCPGYLSSETSVQAAMRRAIQIPSTLAGYSRPMPSVNGEGPYDEPANDNPPSYGLVNMRYHLRQAANLSSLSGAQGFTYGVPELGLWTTPASYWGLPSAVDMQRLADRFRSYPGLPAHPEWIISNPVPYDQQMALASDGSTIAIAYVPPQTLPPPTSTTSSITISTNGLPGLGCPNTGSPWTLSWETPTTNFIQAVPVGNCSPALGQITITSPICTSQQKLSDPECDWVLLLTKTGAAATAATQSSSAALMPLPGKLEVWRDLSVGDGTSAIRAQIAGANTGAAAIEVSPSGLAFQDGARVAAVSSGYVVVWHADVLDGSLLGVFGQRLDATGKLVGPMFRANSTTAYDQRDPALAASLSGNMVVVWSSYGQDGDLGGIFGQLFDAKGNFVGGEFQINSVAAGHQARPQVAYLPSGGFVVGWTTEAIGDNPGALSFRVFAHNGSPITSEIRIPGSDLIHPELVDLQSGTGGGFSLRWLLRANTRATVASYLQQFTAQGGILSNPMALP